MQKFLRSFETAPLKKHAINLHLSNQYFSYI